MTTACPSPMTLSDADLLREVEQFMFHEADLLDWWRLDEWLDLLHEDLQYVMPMARNVPAAQRDLQYTAVGREIAWFDEGKHLIEQRVKQIRTGVHWAEEPLSRISHLVTNVRLLAARTDEVDVSSRFAVYRNRMERETDWYVGKRRDTLRRVDGMWRLLKREIYLDQNVLLPKNLTIFF